LALTFVHRLSAGNLESMMDLIHPSAQRSEVTVALRDRVRNLSINWGTLKSKRAVLSLPVVAPAELRTAGLHRMLRRVAQDSAFSSWLREVPKDDYHVVFVTCDFAHAQIAGFVLVIDGRIGWCTLQPLPAQARQTPSKLLAQDPTTALFNLLPRGEFEAFSAQLPVPVSTYFGAAGVAAMWKMFQDRFGAFQTFQPSAAPAGDSTASLLRCQFERGQLTCRAEWSAGQLCSLAFDA
jgi:hypothetical protein